MSWMSMREKSLTTKLASVRPSVRRLPTGVPVLPGDDHHNTIICYAHSYLRYFLKTVLGGAWVLRPEAFVTCFAVTLVVSELLVRSVSALGPGDTRRPLQDPLHTPNIATEPSPRATIQP